MEALRPSSVAPVSVRISLRIIWTSETASRPFNVRLTVPAVPAPTHHVHTSNS